MFVAIEHHTAVDAAPMMPTVRDLAVQTSVALEEWFGEHRAGELRAEGARLRDTTLVHRTRSALLGLTDGR